MFLLEPYLSILRHGFFCTIVYPYSLFRRGSSRTEKVACPMFMMLVCTHARRDMSTGGIQQ